MPVITVSQLNNYMKRYVDQNPHLSDLWIKGEISNYRQHYSGHIYMTIKDENSSLRAIMFKSDAAKIKFVPADGMRIIAYGKISVYEPGGTYQLYVDSMIPDGVGELYAAYEQLKLKLESQGIFSVEHKKTIPSFPKKIGVISSVSGAAIQDVLNVLKRRYTIADIIIYPVKVQGIGSADSICDALDFFSNNGTCDVIILARGGGSIEDLWAFNEEKTAMAIYRCKIPVITGVGHETDYTISDFVADMRAPTPSAAAEIAVPSMDELRKTLLMYQSRIRNLLIMKLQTYETLLARYSTHFMTNKLYQSIDEYKLRLDRISKELRLIFAQKMYKLSSILSEYDSMLKILNPLSVLDRGYSVTLAQNGKLFKCSDASIDDTVKIILNDGSVECVVRKVIKNE